MQAKRSKFTPRPLPHPSREKKLINDKTPIQLNIEESFHIHSIPRDIIFGSLYGSIEFPLEPFVPLENL